MPNKVLILSRYNKLGASSRYRYYEYLEDLDKSGLDCKISPLLSDRYLKKTYAGNTFKVFEIMRCYFRRFIILFSIRKYDLCLIEKELFPFFPFFVEYFILLAAKKYIVDYDDATFHRYDEHKNLIVRFIFSNKIKKLMHGASTVIVGNKYLHDYALDSESKNIITIPTVVDIEKYAKVSGKKDKQFSIVWIGSQSTVHYLQEIIEPIERISKLVNAKLIEKKKKIDIPGVDIELVDWSQETEINYLKSADVGIMPLSKDNWDKGKCGFKIIQYMASEVPVIASPVGVNQKIIQHDVNGYLAETSDEWFKYFINIYDGIEPDIVQNALSTVSKKYSKKFASPILIHSLKDTLNENLNSNVVQDFGREWKMFSNNESIKELKLIWEDYFNIFPWDSLPNNGGIGADIGCGTGRWSMPVAKQVKKLYLIDPSRNALNVAKKNLSGFSNIEFINKGVDASMPLIEKLDFAYSLGVLHHVPDIDAAFNSISQNLKKGAPFLVYLYHSFEDSPKWYKVLWKISDYLRRIISILPYRFKVITTQSIALIIYWPISRTGLIFSKLGFNTTHFPLIYYSNKPFYFMINDYLDRFGTRLENRFSKKQIEQLFHNSGFADVKFSNKKPFWCACGIKK